MLTNEEWELLIRIQDKVKNIIKLPNSQSLRDYVGIEFLKDEIGVKTEWSSRFDHESDTIYIAHKDLHNPLEWWQNKFAEEQRLRNEEKQKSELLAQAKKERELYLSLKQKFDK